MDLVAHCGWSGAGQFLYTLSMVDVATGWVARAGLRDKRSETLFHALQQLRAELPFRILGLDSDKGTEFINRALLEYCTDQGITFTRSRPYLKNDTCMSSRSLSVNWPAQRRQASMRATGAKHAGPGGASAHGVPHVLYGPLAVDEPCTPVPVRRRAPAPRQ
jgi:Integrase core domain